MVFDTNPMSGRQFANIGEALDGLKAFNALYAVKQCDKDTSLCGNPDDTAMWRKLIWDGVINAGGEPMEIDFFEKIFGGRTTPIDAKKIYFRYNTDMDMNVIAADGVTGTGAGDPATFLLSKVNHSGGGKFSPVAENWSLYIYEDDQWVTISDVDKSTNYGHLVEVTPVNKDYTVNIRRGKKMMVLPVRFVGGVSVSQPAANFQSLGYTTHINPFRIRTDWELPIDINRGYEEILQWAVTFDENGQEVDAWEPYLKTDRRRAMKWAKNLIFFIGQKITNEALIVDDFNDYNITSDYSGFDGYLSSLKHGGATQIDFNVGTGFDFEADLDPVILRNDALKRTNEFIMLHPKAVYMGITRNFYEKAKNNAGSCTFETFKRMGGTAEDIQKLGVRSWSWANFSVHMKEISALSDTRGLGNYKFPYQPYFIPGNGLRDSKGREVPAIQFFVHQGQSASGMLEEFDVDLRKTESQKDALKGYLAESVMMVCHCMHQHMWGNPVGVNLL